MHKVEIFNLYLCDVCTAQHIEMGQAPDCCSCGRVGLTREEAIEIDFSPQLKDQTLNIEGGCHLWQGDCGGCSRYDRIFGQCRSFPRVETPHQVALQHQTHWEDCDLLTFIDLAVRRELEPPAAIVHPDEEVNGAFIVDPTMAPLVANFMNQWGTPDKKIAIHLQRIEDANKKPGSEPHMVLFFNDAESGIVAPTPPVTPEQVAQFKGRENYVILGGITLDLGDLPDGWIIE